MRGGQQRLAEQHDEPEARVPAGLSTNAWARVCLRTYLWFELGNNRDRGRTLVVAYKKLDAA